MARGRTAVLLIHGMGEQRPMDTMRGAVEALLASFSTRNRTYHSRPTDLPGSYEARRYIIPPVYDGGDVDRRPQVEVFEYHWAHLMQGNRLGDLWRTVSRILLRWPWRVHDGLRGVWAVAWTLAAVLLWALTVGPLAEQRAELNDVVGLIGVLAGPGLLGVAVTYVLTKVVPRTVTASFVDVVRYLDTSPRSLQVRTAIRKGAIEHLRELNKDYDRVVVVAHSLGSYIAYDAIRHLWGVGDLRWPRKLKEGDDAVPAGLEELEQAALDILEAGDRTTPAQLRAYLDAQAGLLAGLKEEDVAWRITDLVTLGSPMCMADDLYTDGRPDFEDAKDRQELPACPPVEDDDPYRGDPAAQARTGHLLHYGYDSDWLERFVLSDGAPFAVVRWTNIWFPARWGFFGDWFAGALAPLFGRGIRDVPIEHPSRAGRLPGLAHTKYYAEVASHPDGELARVFRDALRLRFADAQEKVEAADGGEVIDLVDAEASVSG